MNISSSWISGTGETTKVGYINQNKQKVHGTRGVEGTDYNQYSYKLECLNDCCGHIYGANGSDISRRKCPNCQGGNTGINF